MRVAKRQRSPLKMEVYKRCRWQKIKFIGEEMSPLCRKESDAKCERIAFEAKYNSTAAVAPTSPG
jgi:hypothetical protein